MPHFDHIQPTQQPPSVGFGQLSPIQAQAGLSRVQAVQGSKLLRESGEGRFPAARVVLAPIVTLCLPACLPMQCVMQYAAPADGATALRHWSPLQNPSRVRREEEEELEWTQTGQQISAKTAGLHYRAGTAQQQRPLTNQQSAGDSFAESVGIQLGATDKTA
ncbi:uncharacterized protein UV8b_01979 [Ustilaginoidea virens]|uniref:Uncharacterized protein n=1 Tax=Ustilaginoidea virens TaxID=1159556 RepID=A0A8E5HLY9_USTVR|nr:uncharacterized protein UV8b_01979 [Ustilaginoidea virens]QUC17738.1 hypothetical protein UV8b_01979 [Ustilaginoidea virens]